MALVQAFGVVHFWRPGPPCVSPSGSTVSRGGHGIPPHPLSVAQIVALLYPQSMKQYIGTRPTFLSDVQLTHSGHSHGYPHECYGVHRIPWARNERRPALLDRAGEAFWR